MACASTQGYCFIQQNIAYWDEERFSVPNGIVDPQYSYEINCQLFWHLTEPGEYIVKAGTPLVQWIPVHRDILASKGIDVVVETANADDFKNNESWSIIVERILQRILHCQRE